MYKQHSLVMLPSNNKSNIVKLNADIEFLVHSKLALRTNAANGDSFQHLYVISDEEIKEGDWCYDEVSKSIYQELNPERANACNYIWKAIATTDTSLTINGYDSSDEDATVKFKIPSIPQSFITHFINEYNKGNVIDKVMVEMDYYPIEMLINSDNTINIKQCKDSYTREEVEQLIHNYREFAWKNGITLMECDKWIANNL